MSNEWHVAQTGNDLAEGSSSAPLRTIQRAAECAMPGDTVIVHSGVFRERVSPPRGGESDTSRIEFAAAPGEHVIVTGAELIDGWSDAGHGVWSAEIPDELIQRLGDGTHPFRERLGGDWFHDLNRVHHRGALILDGVMGFEVDTPDELRDSTLPEASCRWHVADTETGVKLHAWFGGADPGRHLVEATVRSTVFTPTHPGIDFITVRGFELCHAATPWAPPTAAQLGIIGPHWARGWIIEDNHIYGARCSGISLGQDGSLGENLWTNRRIKHGTQRQRETVFRALHRGWSRDTVGGHTIRRNHIHHCEQTAICGHLGGIFSQIIYNDIHDIHVQRRFSGAEIAGIKLHAAIDTRIAHNRIRNCHRGIWLDWQAQGTRVHANLLSENDLQDFFIEVSHGPCVVDHNILLSSESILNVAQGTCFANNLLTGTIKQVGVPNRFTPYHLPNSTAIAGVMTILGGDDRWFNNLFLPAQPAPAVDQTADTNSDFAGINQQLVGYGLALLDGFPIDESQWETARTPNDYAALRLPVVAGTNGYGDGATPWKNEASPVSGQGSATLVHHDGRAVLCFRIDTALAEARGATVTSRMLGHAFQSEAPFRDSDGSFLRLDCDFRGVEHEGHVGPFAGLMEGDHEIVVWDRSS